MADILDDPDWFPHRVDWSNDRLTFVRARREALTRLSFIDGRSPLSEQTPVQVSLSAALSNATAIPMPAQERYLFHVSFCGSTLLARLLDIPGRSFSLKEPQALVDLADWRAAQRLSQAEDARFVPVLALVRSQLFKLGTVGEAIFIKPSNWVNSLLSELIAGGARFALLDMEPRAFLTAVFRGGRERITYTLRCLTHLQTAFPAWEPLLVQASSAGGDPLDAAARLGAVAIRLQQAMFAQMDPGREHRLHYEELTSRPERTLARAAALLDLNVRDAEMKEAIGESRSTHAKQPGARFDAAAEAAANAEVTALYGGAIERALEWIDANAP